MKTNLLKLLFTFALACLLIETTSAQDWMQDPKYGKSPLERQDNVKNYNLFKDAYTTKDYDKAMEYLPNLFVKVPTAFMNLYIFAANIYRTKIAQSTTLAEKNAYIDSLMMVYDRRVQSFGNHATQGSSVILANKAKDYLANRPMDRDNITKYFQEAIVAQGDNVDFGLVNIYFKELTEDYKSDNIEAPFLMEEYEQLATLFDNAPDKAAIADARSTFDALLIASGAASCENLENLFKANIAAAPEDSAILSKAIAFLNRAKCSGPFLIEVMEKLYALAPDSELAMTLANMFGDLKNNEKSLKYLNLATSGENDPVKKSNLSVQIAARELTAQNPQKAVKFAKEALAANPENGYAYIIMAQAYAIGSGSCEGFDSQTVYWLISDILTKAKNLLAADDPQQAMISESLINYALSFPSKEECFFRGLTTGQSFNVKCGWVTGKTTVREGR
ncbi:MAG: enzyme of heme biosynthesis [Rikenellaceae bacterium]